MANVIRHKRGTSNPVAGDFSQTAELLVNTTDGGLFTKTDGGSVVEIGGSDANKADVSHKYHEFGSGQYFYDNYEQGRYFRLFTENATFSVTRFRTFSNVEYYNTSTSSWTSWSGGVSGVEALLDGRQNTGMNVAHANRKFRFTVNVSSGWPTRAVYFLQSSWSAISYPGITVTLENATSASGTFTTKDTAVFTSSNTGSTWGIHARTTSNLHNGATYVRVTIDITDWTDNGAYTTVPLRNFEILSNYSGSDLLPFSWDYNQNISVSGTVDGRDLAADGSKLDGIESGATADQTASEILTAIKTVDGSGSGLDADTLDGQQGSYYAPLASPTFTGTPAAPTASAGTNTTQVATTAFVQAAVANVVDSAPAALDTLNELAAALGDDANFSTTVTNSIGTKLPLAGGQMTGNITFSGTQTVDGRDLSVDGAKLDGIEAGATADQTASEILTAIKTVDGAASGLDADLLDGQQGDYYLNTSSSVQTKGGDLRVGGSTYNIGIGTSNTNASNTVGHTASYNEGIFWHNSNTNYAIYRTSGTWVSPDYQQLALNWPTGIQLDGGASYGQSGVKVIGNNNSLTVNGNIVLNAGNYTSYSPSLTGSGASGTWGISVTGNAGTATTLATARTIALGGDLSGSASFNGSANITITAAVADDSHNHVISNVDGLQAALDGKASTTSPTFSGDVTMSGTGALKVANGTTAQRPTASNGQIRYNTTLGAIETYVQGAWQVIANTALDYGLITTASDTTFDYGALV